LPRARVSDPHDSRRPRGADHWNCVQVRAIDTAASKIEVQGARYPEHLEKRTGR